MRKTQVDTFKSLLQSKNLRHGPVLNYNGDPEGVVEAKPGTLCTNLNYGTDGIAYYQKVLGHGVYGWSPVYGGSPRSVTTQIESISADGTKVVFTAPEDLVVRKIVISTEVNVDADATTNYWGFNLANYGTLASRGNLGGEMLAADKMVQIPWTQYCDLEVVPDQNRFMKSGSVLELLVDETGAPTALTNVNVTVFYWPGCARTESIAASVGTVSSTNAATTEAFLCRVPKDGYVEKITVTSKTAAASDANDKYDIQVTNLYGDGTGAETLCSTAHDTNTNGDIYAYNEVDPAGEVSIDPCDLVIDQNRFVLEGDVLEIIFTATKDGDLADLTDCVVTTHIKLFDSEDVKAVQGTVRNQGQITVPHLGYERFILFTAPYDCRARNCFLISDAAKALDATDYIEANVWKFRNMHYEGLDLDGRDPDPVLLNSVSPITTETGAAGADAIEADKPWPDGFELVDQNRNLNKGDIVKIEFYAVDGTGTTSETIGTDHTAIIFEIEAWDPDQVGLTASRGRT